MAIFEKGQRVKFADADTAGFKAYRLARATVLTSDEHRTIVQWDCERSPASHYTRDLAAAEDV